VAEGEAWYYDSGDELDAAGDEAGRTLDVTRTYCLYWHAFTDGHWDMLERICRALPGWQAGSADLPRWYSAAEVQAPYLWASVEPPGLQVGGELDARLWREWDQRFRDAIADSGLPVYSCDPRPGTEGRD
jgi:hypothetical protein